MCNSTSKFAIFVQLAVVIGLFSLGNVAGATDAVVIDGADDRLVIVTHPDNQDVITREDLYRLYFGKRLTLSSGAQLLPVVNSGDMDLLSHFSSKMLHRSPQQLRSYWARQLFTGKGKPPVSVKSAVDLKTLIAGDPRFIGFLWESDLDSTVRVVLEEN